MPRNMSFSMTTEAVRNQTKTVTRRIGWNDLKPGTLLWAVEKGMGLKKGEKVQKLALIRVVSVTRQPLASLLLIPLSEQATEMAREGFPDTRPWDFIHHIMHQEQKTWVNRIEFEYVDEKARGDGTTP